MEGRCWFFKVFSTCKTIFKVDIQSQILPELISIWCLYYNVWTRFYLLLCTWRVRSSCVEEFCKKVFLNNSTKFTGRHLRWGLFCKNSQNSSELLLLKKTQQTKTCSKLTKKECVRNVIWLSLWLAWRIFSKSVIESDFLRSSGL